MKFEIIPFLSGFVGGSILTMVMVEPTKQSGFIGTMFIGLIIGICFEEWMRAEETIRQINQRSKK